MSLARVDEPLFPDGDPLAGRDPTSALKPHPQWSGRDVENLAVNDPDTYARYLRGYHALLGDANEAGRDDIRIGSVPVTRNLDTRRYGIGLGGITSHMGELRPGEFLTLGAREGTGKTAAAEMIAVSNARDHKVLFCTLEMTREEIRDRMLGRKLNYPQERLAREREAKTPDYELAMKMLGNLDLLLWHPAKKERGVESILSRAVDTSAELLLIDHARCIDGWTSGNRNNACDKIVERLFEFARETSITTILLSQLNRDGAGRRPTNKYFQDTGFLEQKPDRCILLHRPFLGQPGRDDIAEVIVSKNRQGPCFRGHAYWHGETMRFSSMDEMDEKSAPCCVKRKDREE